MNLGLGLGINKYKKTTSNLILPDSISGLRLWLEADSGVSTTGSLVDQWDDKSINGNDFVKVSDGARPTLDTSTHSFTTIAFDAVVDSHLVKTGGIGLGTGDYTVFIVAYKEVSGAGFGYMFSNGTGRARILFRANHTAENWIHFDGPGSALNVAANDGQWHIGQFFRGAVNKEIVIDNNLSNSQVKLTGTWGTRDIYIGRNINSLDTSFTGYIASIIAYDRELNSSERLDVHNYLSSKYL